MVLLPGQCFLERCCKWVVLAWPKWIGVLFELVLNIISALSICSHQKLWILSLLFLVTQTEQDHCQEGMPCSTHVEGWLPFLVVNVLWFVATSAEIDRTSWSKHLFYVSTNSAKFLVHVLRGMINNKSCLIHCKKLLTLRKMQWMSELLTFLVWFIVKLEE